MVSGLEWEKPRIEKINCTALGVFRRELFWKLGFPCSQSQPNGKSPSIAALHTKLHLGDLHAGARYLVFQRDAGAREDSGGIHRPFMVAWWPVAGTQTCGLWTGLKWNADSRMPNVGELFKNQFPLSFDSLTHLALRLAFGFRFGFGPSLVLRRRDSAVGQPPAKCLRSMPDHSVGSTILPRNKPAMKSIQCGGFTCDGRMLHTQLGGMAHKSNGQRCHWSPTQKAKNIWIPWVRLWRADQAGWRTKTSNPHVRRSNRKCCSGALYALVTTRIPRWNDKAIVLFSVTANAYLSNRYAYLL